MISILLKHSKTDQVRKGMRIVIGKTDDDSCPVTALLTYLKVRGSQPGPLLQWQSGTPLTKTRFVEEVLEAAHTFQPRTLLGIISESEQPPQQHQQASQILLYRLLDDGRALLIFSTSGWSHIS